MMRHEYADRAQQLCNLVNNRRVQVGKEALRTVHIMRAIRWVLGAPKPDAYPLHRFGSWMWEQRIPYVLTDRAIALPRIPKAAE